MISTVLIIGGGQAGAQAIDTLRREGFAGRIVLISEEPELPYQRPPLSKKFLAGELAADRLPFRHQSFYDEHRIELKLGIRAIRLDPPARRVALSNGEEIGYDRLLLCLGAISRLLTCPGSELPGVHYLRGIVGRSGHTRGPQAGSADRHHRRGLHRSRGRRHRAQNGLRRHRAGNGRPGHEPGGCIECLGVLCA